MLAQFCRDVTTTHARAKAAMAVAAHQGFGLRVGQGRIFLGWALAMQGDVATGIAHIRQGHTVHQATGSQLYSPYFLAVLAEAYGQAGQPEVGLQVLAEALTLVATTEERWWEAELYRLQGALLLQLRVPDACQAEASFQPGAWTSPVASRRRPWSSRAALSLARLWQQARQAHRSPTRCWQRSTGWFTEGLGHGGPPGGQSAPRRDRRPSTSVPCRARIRIALKIPHSTA